MIVAELDAHVVQLGDCSTETKAKSVARCCAASLQADESLKDTLPVFDWNSRSVVGNHDNWMPSPALERDRDRRFLRRMSQRVGDEIGEELRQQILIPHDLYAGWNVRRDPMPAFLRRRSI